MFLTFKQITPQKIYILTYSTIYMYQGFASLVYYFNWLLTRRDLGSTVLQGPFKVCVWPNDSVYLNTCPWWIINICHPCLLTLLLHVGRRSHHFRYLMIIFKILRGICAQRTQFFQNYNKSLKIPLYRIQFWKISASFE